MSTQWGERIAVLRAYANDDAPPSLNRLTDEGANPFQILVSTLLSLRTRDEVTLATSRKLFARATTPAEVRQLDVDTLAELIFPAGFYKTKARQIAEIARQLQDRHGDQVPSDREALLALPGVGPKTANLVLNLAFGVAAICVDTHVHRIANRQGWVTTRTPEETEAALAATLPREYWIELNPLLVQYGQDVCTPASPHCSSCPFAPTCPRVGVLHSR